MPDWDEIIRGVGAFFEGASNGAIIGEWLEMGQNDALNSIEEFVKRSSSDRIDSMDTTLLQMANMHFDINARSQIIKYYAFFKVVEFIRFGKWRGFPSI